MFVPSAISLKLKLKKKKKKSKIKMQNHFKTSVLFYSTPNEISYPKFSPIFRAHPSPPSPQDRPYVGKLIDQPPNRSRVRNHRASSSFKRPQIMDEDHHTTPGRDPYAPSPQEPYILEPITTAHH
jgi:hypothetical protein